MYTSHSSRRPGPLATSHALTAFAPSVEYLGNRAAPPRFSAPPYTGRSAPGWAILLGPLTGINARQANAHASRAWRHSTQPARLRWRYGSAGEIVIPHGCADAAQYCVHPFARRVSTNAEVAGCRLDRATLAARTAGREIGELRALLSTQESVPPAPDWLPALASESATLVSAPPWYLPGRLACSPGPHGRAPFAVASSSAPHPGSLSSRPSRPPGSSARLCRQESRLKCISRWARAHATSTRATSGHGPSPLDCGDCLALSPRARSTSAAPETSAPPIPVNLVNRLQAALTPSLERSYAELLADLGIVKPVNEPLAQVSPQRVRRGSGRPVEIKPARNPARATPRSA